MKLDIKPRTNATILVTIDWPELRQMIVQAVLREFVSTQAGNIDLDCNKLRIEVKQETSGSPAYPVDRWRVFVAGEVDLVGETGG